MGVVVSHVPINSPGGSGGTSAAIDTTGANFIVCAQVYGFGGTPSFTDSAGNTWGTQSGAADGAVLTQFGLRTCFNPTTSATHTFTLGGGTFDQAGVVLAVKTAISFDTIHQTGSGTTATTIQGGSVTASASPALVLSALSQAILPPYTISVDSGFTISDQVDLRPDPDGRWGIALAYKFQNVAAAANPTWTVSGATPIGTCAGNYTIVMAEDGTVRVQGFVFG